MRPKHAWPTEVSSIYPANDYAPRKLLGIRILKVRRMPDLQTVACEAYVSTKDIEQIGFLPYTLDKMKRKLDAAVHAHGRHDHGL